MTDAQSLLIRCQELGATLAPGPDGKLRVRAPAPLPEGLRQELKRRKREVLALLEAVAWLRAKLIAPQRIADLIRQWVGERDGINGRWIDDLMAARWALGVQPYLGEDGRSWWKLPETSLH